MTAPTQGLAPVRFRPPMAVPRSSDLISATMWSEVAASEASRHLLGVEIEAVGNYGTASSVGVWTAAWCGTPDEIEPGDRPVSLEAFAPVSSWAHDQCDLTEMSRAEVRERAAQTLVVHEPLMVEREFGARTLLDAGTPLAVPDVVAAVSELEAALAATGISGFILAGAQLEAYAARYNLLGAAGAKGLHTTPGGHAWIFGGGFRPVLGSSLVAVSQPYGWRDQVQYREVIDHEHNSFQVLAERTSLIGYEAAIKAVTITP